MVPLSWYLALSATLFVIGIVGVLIRRNVIVVFLSVELIMNAVDINLIAFSYYLSSIKGQVFTIFIITVAAAEAALGLALIVLVYRNKGTINVDEINLMRW
jgi:NADH-quinone oxidoreductase subunit K